MATRTRASKPARQLGELLQEQQESFILDVYLSERGYGKRSLASEDSFTGTGTGTGTGCHGDSCKFLNKSRSLNKSKQGMPRFSKVVLNVILCNKFFKIKRSRTKNDQDRKLSVTETDRFSSATSATMYNSCLDSDIDDEVPHMFGDSSMPYLENKVVEDANFEENKHGSPRSVLEEVTTSTSSPLHYSRQVSRKRLFWSKLIKVDSILSTWLLNSLIQTKPQKSSCATELEQTQVPDWKSKRVLQQTEQRIREWLENSHGKVEIGKSLKGSVNMKGRRKRCGDEPNIKQLLELDMISTIQDWKKDFESQKKDIGLGIGNAILEEIISEVIMDMIDVL